MLTITGRTGKDIMLLLAAVTLFGGCSQPGPQALLEGKRLLEKGQSREAVEQLKLATALLGNTNAQAFNYLGLACHQAGQAAEAERAYQKALVLNPDLVEARFNLGCLWLSQNRVEQAKTEFIAYTLRRANSMEGWLKLGAAQVRLKEWNGAEKSFGEALRFGPQNPEALTGLGIVHLQRNRSVREAMDLFSKALKAQPDYGPALLNLAVVAQENLKDRQLALHTYQQYLNLKPPGESSEAVRAIVRQLTQEAAPAPKPAAVNVPQTQPLSNSPKPVIVDTPRLSAPAKVVVAETTRPMAVPKPETTNAALKAAPPTNVVKASPTPPPVTRSPAEVVKLPAEPTFKPAEDVASLPPAPRTAEAETLVAAGTMQAPAPTAKPAKRSLLQRLNPINLFSGEGKDPAPPSAANPVGTTDARNSMGETQETVIATTPAFKRYRYRPPAPLDAGNRAEAEPLFAQALRAQQAQRLTEAVQTYRRATEADPSFFDAQYNLGLAAFQANNLPLSLTSYENALAILPESEEARYNFSLALKQANYPLDAAHELEKVLAIYPNDGRAHLALGNLCAQQLRQPSKARVHYRRLLEIDPRNAQAPAVQYWLAANPR